MSMRLSTFAAFIAVAWLLASHANAQQGRNLLARGAARGDGGSGTYRSTPRAALTEALAKSVPTAATFSKVNSRAATQLKQQGAVSAATAGSTGARKLLGRVLLKGTVKGDGASNNNSPRTTLTEALAKSVPAAAAFSKVDSRAATQLKQQRAVGAATAASTGARKLMSVNFGHQGDASQGTSGYVDVKASAARAAATAPDTRLAQLLSRSEPRMSVSAQAAQPEKAAGIDLPGNVRMPKL
jgi:hypothetical protein